MQKIRIKGSRFFLVIFGKFIKTENILLRIVEKILKWNSYYGEIMVNFIIQATELTAVTEQKNQNDNYLKMLYEKFYLHIEKYNSDLKLLTTKMLFIMQLHERFNQANDDALLTEVIHDIKIFTVALGLDAKLEINLSTLIVQLFSENQPENIDLFL